MANDYISQEAAIVEIKRFIGYLDEDMIERLQVAIRRIPAADVRPVMRGEWIPTCMYDYYYKCSACGEIGPLEPQGEGVFRFNFCPNCGADMRDVKVDG